MATVTSEDIVAAAARIGADAHRTPVLQSRFFNDATQLELFFKCEHLQRTGSFKIRGALNAIRSLPEGEAGRGVVTDSSGNFGQALAAAGASCGVSVTVVMPTDAPIVKRDAVRGYGGQVVPCAPTLEARKTRVAEVAAQTGATYISSNDHPHIIAGQGTATLELLSQVPNLDAVIASVGGGGLLSGTAVAARGHRTAVAVFGAEPAGANDTARSLAAGRHLPPENHQSIAGGLLVGMGRYTWDIIREDVEDVIVVNDAEIARAMRQIWERMKQVVEPSAAVALAALLAAPAQRLRGHRRVGVILSGGNVDLGQLPWGPESQAPERPAG